MVKILVVDDEKDVCDFVKSFFEERGFKVLVASNGKEALALAEKEAPLIILMDIRMPHMDGIEALKRIKKKTPQNKVIMVTCVEDIDKVDAAKEFGAETYITKPLVLDELVRAVMSTVPKLKNNKEEWVLNYCTDWRSRCLFKAWNSNNVAQIELMKLMGMKVSDMLGIPIKLGSYSDRSSSLHLYGLYFDKENIGRTIEEVIVPNKKPELYFRNLDDYLYDMIALSIEHNAEMAYSIMDEKEARELGYVIGTQF